MPFLVGPFQGCEKKMPSAEATQTGLMKFSADLPTLDKVFEIITPPNPILRLIFQFRDWLPNDVR